MAKSQEATQTSDGGVSGSLERLREELTGYLGARAHHLTRAAGHRVQHMAGRLAGAPASGARNLVKEAAVEPVKKAAIDPVKKVIPGMGGGDEGEKGEGGDGKGEADGMKSTFIIETVDVGVPLSVCYNHWTSFEGFGKFMKGVQNVERSDDTESDWRAKIGPSTRTWKATTQEQVPDERVEWTSEGSKGTTRGVVSFHELTPRLTRIVVVVEYTPAGFFEKTANIWRAQGRRLRLDLKRFQSHVTLAAAEDEPEGWRGEIREGEVVRGPEDEEPEDQEENEDEDAEGEWEDEDEEEEEEEGEEGEDDEEEEDEGKGKRKGRKRGRR
ncbi:SRPBCC family protein [Streptomyces xiamenensis]|uniref:Polyketide cyclase/dehydrase n=1 Tax=Streptomyces xiamenensis TaxID=408015 RepID=A0A0F7G079_9ACTN|nr:MULTISPECIES: SRPBCC family protein [Streptomyces]AKG46348.1 polyketide cyclase/dehydrase [Streptomyces xiamenensis]